MVGGGAEKVEFGGDSDDEDFEERGLDAEDGEGGEDPTVANSIFFGFEGGRGVGELAEEEGEGDLLEGFGRDFGDDGEAGEGWTSVGSKEKRESQRGRNRNET